MIVRSLRLGLIAAALIPVAGAVAQAQDARQEIEAVNKKFMSAAKSGDAKAIAALYTADAQLMPPGAEIVQGPQAIADAWSSALKSGVAEVVLTTREVQAHGDMAHEIGSYALESKDDKVLDRGKYIVIWKREQGQWKLHRDIWNTSMAQSPAK